MILVLSAAGDTEVAAAEETLPVLRCQFEDEAPSYFSKKLCFYPLCHRAPDCASISHLYGRYLYRRNKETDWTEHFRCAKAQTRRVKRQI